jgi:hypothetical protein
MIDQLYFLLRCILLHTVLNLVLWRGITSLRMYLSSLNANTIVVHETRRNGAGE